MFYSIEPSGSNEAELVARMRRASLIAPSERTFQMMQLEGDAFRPLDHLPGRASSTKVVDDRVNSRFGPGGCDVGAHDFVEHLVNSDMNVWCVSH